jgi:TPR repeat protein
MYEEGRGVLQDYAEASRLYRLAAEQGNAKAQNNLGNMYWYGRGVSQDYVEASRLYRQAAVQGETAAQHNLGNMYWKGRGVAANFITAHMWFEIAAENGSLASPSLQEFLAARMSSDDVAEAGRLAQICIDSIYTDCPN